MWSVQQGIQKSCLLQIVICSQLYGNVQIDESVYVVTKDVEAGKLTIRIPVKVIKDNK